MKPWTIYIWKNGKNMEGASAVATRDGIKAIYRAGWKIEKDPEAIKNEPVHQEWRARINIKNLLNNVLNVINWYGKKVLDKEGNVDPEKFDKLELKTAKDTIKRNYIAKYGKEILNKDGSISRRKLKKLEKLKGKLKEKNCLDMNDVKKIKFYEVKDIKLKTAKKYKLI